MGLDDYFSKLCTSGAAFEFSPKKEMKLDLEKVAEKLRSETLVEAETPFVLMIKYADAKISIFKSGKIIVRNVEDTRKAKKIAEKITELISEKTK